jgi:uncharacterized protein (DUF362 family)
VDDETWEGRASSSNMENTLETVERLFTLKKIGRRNFLKISGIVVVGLALPLGCKKPEQADTALIDDIVRLEMPPPPEGDITVGIVRNGDIAAAVDRAIELAGGLGEIKSGDTVVIKPNLTTGYPLDIRVTTHPEVMRAVIKAVKTRTDASNITVAEASSYADPSTLEVAKVTGIYDVVQSEGVNFLAWEDEEYVEASSFDFRNILFRIQIPKSLADARFKHFINVPMLKNHEAISNSNAEYTCCMKNHVGVISRDTRTGGGGTGIHKRNLGEIIAELNLVVPAHTMNVVDALTVILTDGPAGFKMDHADPGLVIACKDRVACDSLGLAVLRHYASQQGIKRDYVDKSVWRQAQIVRAQELNLGRYKENIRITADGVGEIDAILAKWS